VRPFHSSITPAVIHHEARFALQRCLDWKPFHDSVSVTALLDLLLLMAASTASLFATVRRFFSFSHETGRQAVQANLPSRERLVQGLVQALADVAAFSRRDRRRHWLLAIDTHDVAYYGQRNAYVVGGPKKQGTKWFFRYATAVLLHKHRRYTVALCPVLPKTKPHELVRTLLEQLTAQNLRVRGVALDSAFDSGDTILLLQERGLAYTVPLRRKGSTRNARNRCFEGRHRQIRWVEWTTERSRQRVRTRTLLWKGRPQTRLFAFQGWSGARARNVHRQALRQRQLYRQRFGIETSYRQKNQGQAGTSSSDPVYRLLLEGLGYLLRQVWVVLTEELAQRRQAGPDDWIGELPLARLLDWLIHALTDLHPEECSISLNATG
jgi:hypothetical protein